MQEIDKREEPEEHTERDELLNGLHVPGTTPVIMDAASGANPSEDPAGQAQSDTGSEPGAPPRGGSGRLQHR